MLERIVDEFSWGHLAGRWDTLSDLIRGCELRRHPLGFFHGELIGDSRVAMRLHIWDAIERVAQEPRWFIHTHIFDLKSIVLTGSLTNRLYSWSESTMNANKRLYRITYAGDESCLEATDRVGRCELLSAQKLGAREMYTVNCGEFHNTFVPEGAFTATIALTIKYSGAPLVVGAMDGEYSYSYGRHKLNREDRERIINELFYSVSI